MSEGQAMPEDNGGNWRSLVFRHKKSLITLALFVVYAAAVFWVNYSSLHRLQENSLTQFRLETEKQASAISYFFSERISDISELAESSVVEAFFTNRDLGMSYEYGLGVNVQLIADRFERLAMRKRCGWRMGWYFTNKRNCSRERLFLCRDGKCRLDGRTRVESLCIREPKFYRLRNKRRTFSCYCSVKG